MESESDGVSIELHCEQCGKTLRVDDKYAGRRASCPSCHAPVDIPEKLEELEELEELEPLDESPDADDSGYAVDEHALDALAAGSPAPPQPMTQAEKLEAAGLAAPTPTKGKKHGAKPLPGHEAKPQLTDREKAAKADARRSLITKAVLVLVIFGALAGGAYWYMTTLGAMVQIASSQSVRTVHALQGISPAEAREGFNPMNNPLVQMRGGAPSGAPGTSAGPDPDYLVIGGGDGLYVVRPDGGGDYLLVELDVREGLMKARNQWSGYNVRFRQSQFEVTANTGQTVQPILLQKAIASPASVYLDKGSNPTPVMPVGYQPTSTAYESKGRNERAAGTLAFDGSNGVTGQLSFRSLRAFNPSPGVSGITAEGQLELRSASGMQVDYTYSGYAAEVAWSSGDTGWVSTDSYMLGSVTTMEMHRCALLIPKPAGATRLVINMGGEHLVTVSTTASSGAPSGPPAPSTPAPSTPPPGPVASGGALAPPVNAAGAAPASNPNPLGYFSALAQARDKARGTVAASNMRQIGVALHAFAAQNNDAFPESLDEIREFIPAFDELVKNPHTGEDVGFIYEPPAPDDDPATTPILWESRGGYKDLSGYVLYADGHVKNE
ncbi:MAG: hypothetical protein AAGI54_14185 [Planctomycetota bacterium]